MNSREKSFKKALDEVELHAQETAFKRRQESRRDKLVLEQELKAMNVAREVEKLEARELREFNHKHDAILLFFGLIAWGFLVYSIEITPSSKIDTILDLVLIIGYVSMMFGKIKSKK